MRTLSNISRFRHAGCGAKGMCVAGVLACLLTLLVGVAGVAAAGADGSSPAPPGRPDAISEPMPDWLFNRVLCAIPFKEDGKLAKLLDESRRTHNPELRDEIAKHLDEVEYLSIGSEPLTGEHLKELKRFPNLRRLVIESRVVKTGALAHLEPPPFLERLSIRKSWTGEELAALRPPPNLKTVMMHGMNLTSKGVECLANFTGLEELELVGIPSSEALGQVRALKGLKRLRLTSVPAEDAYMQAVASLTGPEKIEITIFLKEGAPSDALRSLEGKANIRSLHLFPNRKRGVREEDMRYVGTFKNLQELDLFNNGLTSDAGLTDAGLAHVANLVHLKTLTFCPSKKITDDGLAALAPLVNLETLRLHYCPIDEGLVHLRGLKNLRELDLRGTRVTEKGAIHLGALDSLRILKLDGTPIPDAGLKPVGRLQNLQLLGLSSPGVTHVGLAHLLPLKKLRVLFLAGCWGVDDRALVPLGKMESLIYLGLSYTPVTDKGLVHLRGMKNLKYLDLLESAADRQNAAKVLGHLDGLYIMFSDMMSDAYHVGHGWTGRPVVDVETLLEE